jgi:hypothetical protein
MLTMRDLLPMRRPELRSLARTASPIHPDMLDGEWRGTSLGLPRLVERLTWKKFMKVFSRDPKTRVLRGWNVRIEQNGLDAPWIPRRRRGAPIIFGHFVVVDAPGADGGVILDYGAANGPLHPMSRIRDPLLALGADLLLGWSDLALGKRRFETPTFFCLERSSRRSCT